MPPKYLYKYAPINKRTIENLTKNQIYMNNPTSFNDPFDCSFQYKINEELVNHYIKELKPKNQIDKNNIKKILQLRSDIFKHTAKKNYVCSCFSKTHKNILMWSHYAHKHKGLCIKFKSQDNPFNNARKINYTKKLPTIDLYNWIVNNNDKEFYKLFTSKLKLWKYEKEYRILNSKENQLLKYNREAIESIYFGINATEVDMSKIIKIFDKKIDFYKARQDTSQYKVHFKKIVE